MKILCTGGLGFVGSHFVEAAEAAGHEVEILDVLAYSGRTANLAPNRRWHRCDIGDRAVVEALLTELRPDAVVNLAAETHVARSLDCRDEFLRTNVVGTNALLEACLGYWRDGECDPGFRFLHVSTDEVYGSLGFDEAPWTEASPYKPNNPYAASKAASDHLVRAFRTCFGLPTITTHCSNNYGTRQHPEKLIPALIRRCAAGLPMQLHGDGRNVRDWIHVEDHCAGLIAALTRGTPGETYNFGGCQERTNLQIAYLVAARVDNGPGYGIDLIPDRAGNDRRYGMNVEKAAVELDWHPRRPIGAYIAKVVNWYLLNLDYELSYGH